MNDKSLLIRARLAVLALAAEVKNVSKACRIAGVSRSQFYLMKKAYETYGKEGLAPRPRRKPVMPNRTPDAVEEQILSITRNRPMASYIRLAKEMTEEGIVVTPTMVRYVWQRHGLSTRLARLTWVGHSVQRHQSVAVKNNSIANKLNYKASQGHQSMSGNARIHNGGKLAMRTTSSVDWKYWGNVVKDALTNN